MVKRGEQQLDYDSYPRDWFKRSCTTQPIENTLNELNAESRD